MVFALGDRVGCFLQQSKEYTVFIGFGRVVAVDTHVDDDIHNPILHEGVDRIQLDDDQCMWRSEKMKGLPRMIWSCECAVYDEEKSLKILFESDLVEHIWYEEVLRLRQVRIEMSSND